MTRDAWDIVNTVAQSFSAVGTLAAVIVSLYLARHQTSARIVAHTGIGNIVTPGVPGSDMGLFFQIRVTNASFRDLTVTNLGWRVGWVRPVTFIQLVAVNPLSARIPVKLAPSETANFLFPWTEYARNAGEFKAAFGHGRIGRLRAKTTRLCVFLSTGEELRFRLSKSVVVEFLRQSA